MPSHKPSDFAVEVLRAVIVTLVRRDVPTLSAHQFSVFLSCYLHAEERSVAGLAQELGVSKAVVSRVLDKLDERGLTRRREDAARPGVFVERTRAGLALLDDLRRITTDLAASLPEAPAAPARRAKA